MLVEAVVLLLRMLHGVVEARMLVLVEVGEVEHNNLLVVGMALALVLDVD